MSALPADAPAPVRRLLDVASSPSLSDHERAYGPLAATAADLVGEIAASGLTGRGGAAFPVARKIAALTAPPAQIIANVSEGEPLSAKDRTLARRSPHLILDGLELLARALNPRAALQVMAHPEAADALAAAIAERPDAPRFALAVAEDRFVAGESSAVVAALTGRAQIPVDQRGHLTDADRRGGPVLLQNAETLAQIALIARYGAAWFRTAGAPEDPGTRLVTIVPRAGELLVREIEGGSRTSDALAQAGVDPAAVQAVLVGGFHGRWIRGDELTQPLAARPVAGGAPVGAGVLLVLGQGHDALAYTADVLAYLAEQSAGQCGPCVLGLPRLARSMRELAGGTAPGERVRTHIDLVAGRGACHHPDGAARLAASALDAFAPAAAVVPAVSVGPVSQVAPTAPDWRTA